MLPGWAGLAPLELALPSLLVAKEDFSGQGFAKCLVASPQAMATSAGQAEVWEGLGTMQKPGSAAKIQCAGAAANYSFFNNGVYYLPLMVVQGAKVKRIQLPKALALTAIFITQETFAGEMQSLHFGLGNSFS